MAESPNERIVRRFIEELWNGRQFALADELIANDCWTHQLRSGPPLLAVPRGPAMMKLHIAAWLRGFPDLRYTIEQIFSSGDKVFSQARMEGTHTGEWQGLPPTNRPVIIRMMAVHRIADGKIAEDWVLVESRGFFQQLGLIPPTEELLTQAASP